MKAAKQITVPPVILKEFREGRRMLTLYRGPQVDVGDRVHILDGLGDALEAVAERKGTGTAPAITFSTPRGLGGAEKAELEESNPVTQPEVCGPAPAPVGTPRAPDGYEWILLPARPDYGDKKAPGETGHYSDLNPEPIQVFEAWGLDGLEFAMMKYAARYKKKGGVRDLEKIKFYADRLIARERREGRG